MSLKCKLFGHKWNPVFVEAGYNGKTLKFITCYCERCGKGHEEVTKLIQAGEHVRYGTYSEKYFDESTLED